MQVVDSYPGDAAKGADYLTGAAQRDIVVDPRKSVAEGGTRKERIILTDLYLDHEGRVCISETSVQHMANLLGMFEGTRVLMIVEQNEHLRSEVAGQQALVVALQNRIAGLEGERLVEYVGLDGNTYSTVQGAAAAQAPTVEPIYAPTPLDAPDPGEPEPPKRSAEDQAEIVLLHQRIAVLEDELEQATAPKSDGGESSLSEEVSPPPPSESRRERRRLGK